MGRPKTFDEMYGGWLRDGSIEVDRVYYDECKKRYIKAGVDWLKAEIDKAVQEEMGLSPDLSNVPTMGEVTAIISERMEEHKRALDINHEPQSDRHWTSFTDGAFTLSEGVWDTPVGRCIVEPGDQDILFKDGEIVLEVEHHLMPRDIEITMNWSISDDEIVKLGEAMVQGVEPLTVADCAIREINAAPKKEEGMGLKVGDTIKFKDDGLAAGTDWSIAEFDRYEGGQAIRKETGRSFSSMEARILKEIRRPDASFSFLLKCSEVMRGAASESSFTGMATADFLDEFVRRGEILLVAPDKPQASTPDDPHAGMVYNPITDSWSWGF